MKKINMAERYSFDSGVSCEELYEENMAEIYSILIR